MMSASAVVFYILAFFILATGLLAVTSRKIFRSAIWLLFALTGIAGLYFWMQMDFIAAVQIVVYVGGVVVLILFSILLTERSGAALPAPARGRVFVAAVAGGVGFALTWAMLRGHVFSLVGSAGAAAAGLSAAGGGDREIDASVGRIGGEMLSTSEHGYVLPFEVVSILLLAAMIGCIVIAIKTKPGDK
jgi:NADH-quinone oxidoreductase subunit J